MSHKIENRLRGSNIQYIDPDKHSVQMHIAMSRAARPVWWCLFYANVAISISEVGMQKKQDSTTVTVAS